MSFSRKGTPWNGPAGGLLVAAARACAKAGMMTAFRRGLMRSTRAIAASTSSIGFASRRRTSSACPVASSQARSMAPPYDTRGAGNKSSAGAGRSPAPRGAALGPPDPLDGSGHSLLPIGVEAHEIGRDLERLPDVVGEQHVIEVGFELRPREDVARLGQGAGDDHEFAPTPQPLERALERDQPRGVDYRHAPEPEHDHADVVA